MFCGKLNIYFFFYLECSNSRFIRHHCCHVINSRFCRSVVNDGIFGYYGRLQINWIFKHIKIFFMANSFFILGLRISSFRWLLRFQTVLHFAVWRLPTHPFQLKSINDNNLYYCTVSQIFINSFHTLETTVLLV